MTTISYPSGYEATKGVAISEANLEMPVLYKMLEYHGAWANTFSCSWTDDIAIRRYRGKVPKQVIVLCQKEDKKKTIRKKSHNMLCVYKYNIMKNKSIMKNKTLKTNYDYKYIKSYFCCHFKIFRQ